MTIRTMAAVTAVGLLTLIGCSSSGTETGGGTDTSAATTVPSRERTALVRAMVSEGATEEVANCFIDEVGVEGTVRIRATQVSELSDADNAAIEQALQTCDPSLLGAGTTAP